MKFQAWQFDEKPAFQNRLSQRPKHLKTVEIQMRRLLISRLICFKGARWLIGRVLDSRPRGRGFEPHRHHCVVSLSKNINPSLVLVQPRKTRPFITERVLMGRKESNETKQMSTFNYQTPIHQLSLICTFNLQ